MKNEVLPYRTTGEDLTRLINEVSKGRDFEKIQTLFPSRNYSGSVTTAVELGLLDDESQELTELGKSYALADRERKRKLLLKAMLLYEPYELLLAANFAHGYDDETELDWIEKWWTTNGYGNSETNRSDASTSLAKLIEYVNLGNYVVGRRGRPSRIEWAANAKSRIDELEYNGIGDEAEIQTASGADEEEATTRAASTVLNDRSPTEPKPFPEIEGNSFYTLNFAEGRVAHLSLPPRLQRSEKKQLLGLIDLMIQDEGQQQDAYEEDVEE